eukprot:SAG22_NODE_1067_length_5742_cov_15.152224_2_plen_67_part_00
MTLSLRILSGDQRQMAIRSRAAAGSSSVHVSEANVATTHKARGGVSQALSKGGGAEDMCLRDPATP